MMKIKPTRPFVPVLLGVAAALLQTACLSRTAAEPTRHFEPEKAVREAGAPWTTSAVQHVRADAPEHLRDRMAWRVTSVEMAFDDDNRWVADPARMVEDALRRALQERGGLTIGSNTRGRTLDIHVTVFEGCLDSPAGAHIELQASFYSERGVALGARRFTTTEPLGATTAESLAHSMGVALQGIASEVADWASVL